MKERTWILNNAIVLRRNYNHRLRSKEYLVVVLPYKRLWTYLDSVRVRKSYGMSFVPTNTRVGVYNMNKMIRLDSNNVI
jgi:hypothetical protein